MTNNFLVQLHMHASETSACGKATGAEMARACKDAGYGLIVITDHFMNANIACPHDAEWTEKVRCMTKGYESAKAEGDRIGLKVLFAWETNTFGPEYLTYGLDSEFLLDNPDIADVGKDEYLARVHAAGAFVCHAHPYRKAAYIPDFTPDPTHVDAIEVFNGSHKDPTYDQKAYRLARDNKKIMLAGSDAHRTEDLCAGAMRFPYEISTMDELISAIKAGDGKIVERFIPNIIREAGE